MKKLFLVTLMLLGLAVSAAPITTNDLSHDDFTAITKLTDVDAFCKLIQQGNYDAVKDLILAGVDVNKKSVGKTPLMYAARHNKVEIIKLLLANGAELRTRCDRGYTALDYAKLSKAVDAETVILNTLESQNM